MQIRPANLNDSLSLSQLLAQVWRTAYCGIFPQTFLDNIRDDGWVEGFNQSLTQQNGTILVAEIEHKIVAMIAFGQARDADFISHNEIYALNVLPDFQHQGIGSALMKYVLNEQKLENKGVYLKVAIENHQAQKFYTKHGFHNTNIEQLRQIADFSFREWVYRHSS